MKRVGHLILFCATFLVGCALLPPGGGMSVERVLDRRPATEPTEVVETETDTVEIPKPPRVTSNIPARLQWPLRNMKLSSAFGRRFGTRHQGVDLHAPLGTPIYAAAAGVVLYAGNEINGYGEAVVIRHDGGISTLYAHASELIVQEGQEVERGQAIAYVGQTGNATGPHLHFEVRAGKKPVDPWSYVSIPRRLVRTPSSKTSVKAKGSTSEPNSRPPSPK